MFRDTKEGQQSSSRKEVQRAWNLEMVNPRQASPSTSNSSGSFFPHSPPPARLTTKNGEHYVSTPELRRQLHGLHQSYEMPMRALKEEMRTVKDENRSQAHDLAETKQRLADSEERERKQEEIICQLRSELSLLQQTTVDEPTRSPSLSREMVKLTRECSDFRRFCESESKAKKALQKELAEVCADRDRVVLQARADRAKYEQEARDLGDLA